MGLNNIFINAQNNSIEQKLKQEHAPILQALQLSQNILGDSYFVNTYYYGYPTEEPTLSSKIEFSFGPGPVGCMMLAENIPARFSVDLKTNGKISIDEKVSTTHMSEDNNFTEFKSNKPIEVIASLMNWTSHQLGNRELSPENQAIINQRLEAILSQAPDSSHLITNTAKHEHLKIVG